MKKGSEKEGLYLASKVSESALMKANVLSFVNCYIGKKRTESGCLTCDLKVQKTNFTFQPRTYSTEQSFLLN